MAAGLRLAANIEHPTSTSNIEGNAQRRTTHACPIALPPPIVSRDHHAQSRATRSSRLPPRSVATPASPSSPRQTPPIRSSSADRQRPADVPSCWGIHRSQLPGESRFRFDSSPAVYRFSLLGSLNVQILRVGEGEGMRIPRNPKGSMVGVTTAMIALGLLASWSWHHHRWHRDDGSVRDDFPRGGVRVGGASRCEVHRAAGQLACTDSDFGGRLRNDIAPRRAGTATVPPVADRVVCDPVARGRPGCARRWHLRLGRRRRRWRSCAAGGGRIVGRLLPEQSRPADRSSKHPTSRPVGRCPDIVLANLDELRARQVATDWVDRVATCLRALHRARLAGRSAGR